VPIDNQTVESIGPGRWRLAGSVKSAEHLLPLSHSLKLTRHINALSPQIQFAAIIKSTLPKVEIKTPGGIVTLLNAKIVDVASPVRRYTPNEGTSRELYHANELEEIDLTFRTITFTNAKSSTSASDDWIMKP
jgi:type VI protein secretion system component Hcp